MIVCHGYEMEFMKNHAQNLSFWMQSLPANMLEFPQPILQSEYDVAIVGAGFSGLWLAYYLKQAQPEWKIAIFEAKHIGYGASGRNGGWLSTNIPIVIGNLLKNPRWAKQDVVHLQRQIIDTIAEVANVCEREQIDCDLHQGGLMFIATSDAQASRLQDYHAEELAHGFLPHEIQWLGADAAKQHINIDIMQAATHYQYGARIHPAKLVLGLARKVIALGVDIFENTPVQNLSTHTVYLSHQAVKGQHIIACTEGYTDQLLQDGKVIPVNSSIIMTQVLPASFWERVGWQNNELLGDMAHVYMYAQKTADYRILFGGRGAPYQYGSRDAGDGELDHVTTAQLLQRLRELFPRQDFQVDTAWKGSLGVTRDWNASVTFDDKTGLGFIYGFGGNGVAPTHLAARTMTDRILGKHTALTTLPWNDYVCPTWEGEPWRWLGIQSMYQLLGLADQVENRLQLKKSVFFANTAYQICGLE